MVHVLKSLRAILISAAVAVFVAPQAFAQVRTGPLQIQNNLSEIAANGSGAQAQALINLGLTTVVTGAGTGLSLSGNNLSVLYGTTAGTALEGSLLGVPNGIAQLNSSGKIDGSLMPAPSPTSRGGVLSFTAPAGQFMTGITINGYPQSASITAEVISGLAPSATIDTTNAANISYGILPSARLPAPTLTTLGGVESVAQASHQFVTFIDTSGVPHLAQPVAGDVSGLAPSATTDTTNAANISSGTLPSGRLPVPSTSTLGGIQSIANVTHQFISFIDTSGVPHLAQPGASDISGLAPSATTDTTNAANISSGTLPSARLPTPTLTTLGGVESIASVSHEFVTSIDTSGVPHLTALQSGDVTSALGFTPQTNALTSANLLVGNISGVAAAVSPSGDVSMTNAGVFSVGNLSHVTNASLPNSGLVNSGLTLGSTGLTLGGTVTDVAGLTLSSPTISGGTVDNAVIGGVTPAAVSVTSLTANSTVTLSGVSAAPALFANISSMNYSSSGNQPYVFNMSANPAGTLPASGNYAAWNFVVPNDTTNATAGSGYSGMALTYQMGFAAAGGHTALNVNAKVAGAVTNIGSNGFIVGINDQLSATAAVSAGHANMIAFSPSTNLFSGATGYSLIESIEGAVGSVTTLAGGRFGMTMFSSGSVQGNSSQGDAGIAIAGLKGDTQFTTAYAVGRNDSPWGVLSTGTILGPLIQTNGSANGYIPQLAALGVDLGSVNFSNAAYRSPGFDVDPSGIIYGGDLKISTSGTTATLDVPGSTGSTASLSNAGASYVANDQVYDTIYDGIFSVDTVNGSGNVQTYHWIQPPHCFSGCPSTLALTGGSGNGGLIANVIWTAGTTIGIGTSSATAINLGHTGSTTTIAGTLSASGTVSGTGFSNYLASPPAIGGTAPAAGSFTTLGSTGTATFGTGSATDLAISGGSTSATLQVNTTGGSGGLNINTRNQQPAAFNNTVTSGGFYSGGTGTYTFSGSQNNPGTQFGYLFNANMAGSVSSGTISMNSITINSDTSAIPHGAQGATWFGLVGNYGINPWAQSASYTSGAQRAANGNIYTETVASCTSASSGTGPTGTGTGITDGTCSWSYVALNGAGARSGINISQKIISQIGIQSGGNDADRQWQAAIFTTTISANQGGTAPHSGSSAGFVYGGGAQLQCNNGATDLSGCIGWEDDVGIASGASAAQRIGHQVIAEGANQGGDFDAAYRIGSATSSSGLFNVGFMMGAGGYPIATTGAVLQYNPPTPGTDAPAGIVDQPPVDALGIDLYGILHTTAAYRSAGAFVVDGAGALNVASAKLSVSGATLTLDNPGNVVASAAVHSGAGGVGYQSTDHVYDAYGGIYTVTVSGGVITGLAQTAAKGGTSASSPPCTSGCTLYGGTGAGAEADLTWTAGTTLAIGPTSATAINIGNSGSTTTISGTIKAGSSIGVNCPSGITAGTVTVVNGIVTHC
jgi:hypothetical protein